MSLTVFLSTLAIQIGSAYLNNRRGKAHSEEMARRQRAYEEKAMREGIDNAREEFAELCAFQREMDYAMQRDRMELIAGANKANITLDAYDESLHDWPLLVPPYVIRNDGVLSMDNAADYVMPLNCILTPSSDGSFNISVFTRLEEALAEFCSDWWNVSADKSIRFLQETWRDTLSDGDSRRKNLYVHLKHVPTLVLSPIIKDDRLIFRFYWWGLSPDPAEARIDELNEFDPGISVPVSRGMKYDDATVAAILAECAPRLQAFISYFADLYYWNFYKRTPKLPVLLKSGQVKLSPSETVEYIDGYKKLVTSYLDTTIVKDSRLVVETVKTLAEIDTEDEVVSEVGNKILEKKDSLQVSDLPLINGLYELNSSDKARLSEVLSDLASRESISVRPCSNSEELLFAVKKLIAYYPGNTKTFIRFMDETSMILCVADMSRNVLFSNPTSRFHLFVLAEAVSFEQESVEWDINNRKFRAVDSSFNPCNKLAVDKDKLCHRIQEAKLFLTAIRDVSYKQPDFIVNMRIMQEISHREIHVVDEISLSEIESWVKSKSSCGARFKLVVFYNVFKKCYFILGCFLPFRMDSFYWRFRLDRLYLGFSRFLSPEIVKKLGYRPQCIFKLQ